MSGTNENSEFYIDKELFIYRHKKNFEMLCKNYEELDKSFQKLHDKGELNRIWKKVYPDELDSLIFEITRLLSNFIFMAKAVIDVNRVLLNKNIENEKFRKENQEEISNRFTNNPLAQFIEDLRNYSLHYESPIGNVKPIIIDEKVIDSELLLKKNKLEKWGEWKKGKDFLKNQEDNIQIEKLVRQYYELVLDYNEWFVKRVKKIF